MGRVFQIGMGQDGNFAVTNIVESASPAVARSGLSGTFGSAVEGFSQVSAEMGLGGGTPSINQAVKYGR
jgi:hypothetical protein